MPDGTRTIKQLKDRGVKRLEITYKNSAVHHIYPLSNYYDHELDEWLLEAYDLDSDQVRCFFWKDIEL